jgi:hypothetical protein
MRCVSEGWQPLVAIDPTAADCGLLLVSPSTSWRQIGLAERPVKQQGRYLSYLLRLWQEDSGGLPDSEAPLWRASLERPQSDERLGFASLEDLLVFLEVETASSSPGLERPDEGGCQTPAIPD